MLAERWIRSIENWKGSIPAPRAARKRDGRNAHGSQTEDAGDAAEIAGFDQHHRICKFSVAEELCRRVKRWREGDHRERWAGSALLRSESKFRSVKGYRQIPQLLSAPSPTME
jgi:hypothetical protein